MLRQGIDIPSNLFEFTQEYGVFNFMKGTEVISVLTTDFTYKCSQKSEWCNHMKMILF